MLWQIDWQIDIVSTLIRFHFRGLYGIIKRTFVSEADGEIFGPRDKIILKYNQWKLF